jgi:uncharacterized membrane protein YjjP (DUF1212 family)
MADVDDEHVEAEADEGSRWMVTCLSFIAGVSLVYISFSLGAKYLDDYFIMLIPMLLLSFLGVIFIDSFIFLIFEQCGGMYIIPERSLADDMLIFFD